MNYPLKGVIAIDHVLSIFSSLLNPLPAAVHSLLALPLFPRLHLCSRILLRLTLVGFCLNLPPERIEHLAMALRIPDQSLLEPAAALRDDQMDSGEEEVGKALKKVQKDGNGGNGPGPGGGQGGRVLPASLARGSDAGSPDRPGGARALRIRH